MTLFAVMELKCAKGLVGVEPLYPLLPSLESQRNLLDAQLWVLSLLFQLPKKVVLFDYKSAASSSPFFPGPGAWTPNPIWAQVLKAGLVRALS